MSSSESRQRTETTSQTVNTSRNLNVQDVEGITIADNAGPVNVIQSDYGAISDAAALGQHALDVSQHALDVTAGVTTEAFDYTRGQTEAALNFGRDSMSDALDFADSARQGEHDTLNRALEATASSESATRAFSADVLTGVADFAKGLVTQFADFTADTSSRNSTQLGNTVSALNNIATERATSDATRFEGITKTALLIAGGIAAVFALSFAFRRS